MRLSVVALALLPAALFAQEEKDRLAPYYPTPETVVDRMLTLGELKAGETTFDLGSGDGRIVIMAARKYKAKAIGVEFDADLVKLSQERIKQLGLEKNAKIILGDALAQDYSSAELLTIYLLPTSNDKVRPMLEKQLKKGTRIVCHDFEIAGWTPEKTVTIDDDGEGRAHTLFLYRR